MDQKCFNCKILNYKDYFKVIDTTHYIKSSSGKLRVSVKCKCKNCGWVNLFDFNKEEGMNFFNIQQTFLKDKVKDLDKEIEQTKKEMEKEKIENQDKENEGEEWKNN